jgi:hypothetical protein
LVQSFSLLKLPRLLRLNKIMKMMDKLAAATFFRIFRLLFAFSVIGHLIGCIWFLAGRLQDSADNPWVQQYQVPSGARAVALAESSIVSRYTSSIYWALTTMCTVGMSSRGAWLAANGGIVLMCWVLLSQSQAMGT